MTTATDAPAEPGPLDQPFPNMPPPPPPRAEPPAAGRGRPAKRPAGSRPAAKKPAAGPSAPRPRTRPAPAPVRHDYRQGIRGAVESACIPLAILAMRGDRLAALNLATLDLHKDTMAESAQQLAEMNPLAERVVGMVAGFGPMAGVASGLLMPFVQMAVNAGAIPWPLGQRLGCVHPDVLLARLATFDAHADQAAAQASAPAQPAPAPAPAPEPAPVHDPVI